MSWVNKKHNWTAITTVKLTEEQAEELHRTGRLSNEFVVSEKDNHAEVGCYDCELTLNQAWGKPCLGEPEEE